MLIATAGHVDHGKTALVRALTGVDTDRLPEEKKRGLTIDLGFAYRTVAGGRRVGFVDVPGHERFVRNMLSGVPAIDLVMLVVAADDGVMPQTREHLAIVSLLGVRKAVVVISKIDLVDAARLAVVKGQIAQLLAATALADAPVFPISAIAGQGITELETYLQALADELPARHANGHFRLAVDRCFSVAGAGLVVTGAVYSGTVHTGDHLRLLPADQRVRVRSIHSQGEDAQTGLAGQRCAINITGPGISLASVQRGDWLSSLERDALSDRIDVRLHLLASEKTALKHWTPVHIHIGAGSCTGRVALLEGKRLQPGDTALAQLVLDKATVTVFSDHYVLRDQSARRTIGGGRVIDPFAPQRGRSRPERIALLRSLDTPDNRSALQGLLDSAPQGVDLRRFAFARNLIEAEAEPVFEHCDLQLLAGPATHKNSALSAGRWRTLCEVISCTLADFHAQHPQSVGTNAQQLRYLCPSKEAAVLFNAALQSLLRSGVIVREGMFLRLSEHQATLSEEEQRLREQILQYVNAKALKPPALKDLAALLEHDRGRLGKTLEQFAGRGLFVRVSATRFFHPQAMTVFADVCRQLCEQSDNGLFDARSFRDAACIGRNAAIEILEYFDRIAFTQRLGDQRRLHPQHHNAADA